MTPANYEYDDIQGMMKNFKRASSTILILCAAPSVYWGVKTVHWVTVSLMAGSGCIGLASVHGLIYIQFRKN